MRIVYKKLMSDEIVEAIEAADLCNRKIDYIELTQLEFERLRLENPLSCHQSFVSDFLGSFCGVTLRGVK